MAAAMSIDDCNIPWEKDTLPQSRELLEPLDLRTHGIQLNHVESSDYNNIARFAEQLQSCSERKALLPDQVTVGIIDQEASGILKVSPTGQYGDNVEQYGWTKSTVLGRGGFGSVYLALDNYTRKTFALKEMRLEKFRSNEVTIPCELACSSGFNPILGVSLRHYIKFYDELGCDARCNIVWKLLSDILPILEVMEKKDIIHCDIKPENICQYGDKWTLIDYGSSVRGVTLPYMPPEQLSKCIHPGVDVWALAATCIYCLTGKCPWFDLLPINTSEEKRMMSRMIKSDSGDRILSYIPSWCQPLLVQFLTRMLQIQSYRRMSATDAVAWLCSVVPDVTSGIATLGSIAPGDGPAVLPRFSKLLKSSVLSNEESLHSRTVSGSVRACYGEEENDLS